MRNFPLLCGVAAAALLVPFGVANAQSEADNQDRVATMDVVTVTAQRREGNLQDTPIAVTALGQDDLKDQLIDDGSDLASIVPNMSFQPGSFGKPNFAIRGVGFQLVTATGEPGVAVHINDTPTIATRIARAEFFDTERLEVLRGPQGTLFGRNATGGVVNIITAKPDDEFAASLTGEIGSYERRKLEGMVNLPITDRLALRVAGNMNQRDGYQTNVYDGQEINGLEVNSQRVTLLWEPTNTFDATFMYERFQQDDNSGAGGSVSQSVCFRDPGPDSVGGVSLTDGNAANTKIRNYLSFGCKTAFQERSSIYNESLYGQPVNAVGTVGNRLGVVSGYMPGDMFANLPALGDPYLTNVDAQPQNDTENSFYQMSLNWDVTDTLTLSSITSHLRDRMVIVSGGLRSTIPFNPFPGFPVSSPQIANGEPLNFYTTGAANDYLTKETTQEIRLQSDFGGAFDFNLGLFYLEMDKVEDVFVFDNSDTYYGTVLTGQNPIDPNPPIDADGGHYYYQSHNPYSLTSKAIFGEVVWKATDTISVTAGLRHTIDEKTFYANNSAASLLSPGEGYTFSTPQQAEFNENTGRILVDWQPELNFTDQTLIYGSLSRGYKGGGFNPPNLPGIPESYEPEYVDAIEIGTKNTLLDGRMTLNVTGFSYDYKGYQFTQSANLGTKTANVDAKISGLEIESVWQPVDELRINAQLGLQDTEIQEGPDAFTIDTYHPTQGVAGYFPLKSLLGSCIVNEASLAGLLGLVKAGVLPDAVLFNGCPSSADPADDPFGLYAGIPEEHRSGVPVSIAGNRLPNVPSSTAALGIQYTFDFANNWQLTPRMDYRYVGDQHADLFNNEDMHVKSYDAVNLTVTLEIPDHDVTIRAFAKNLGAEGEIVGARPAASAITGSGRTIIISDPETYGLSLSARF